MRSEAITKTDLDWHHLPDEFACRFQIVGIADDHLFYKLQVEGRRYSAWHRYDFPRCALHYCDKCGRLQAARRCHIAFLGAPVRGMAWIKADFGSRHLCIGCYSKYRAMLRLVAEFKEIRRLINHLDKEITRARQNDYGVSTPSLAAIDRGRSYGQDGPSRRNGSVKAGGAGERLASG